MPIYEYRCDSCGFQKEYIQRMSDAVLTDCPECRKPTFNKMVTAAGFQLKGGGWYVTDFKGSGNAGGASKKPDEKQSDTTKKSEGAGSADSSASSAPSSSTATASTASTPASSGGGT